MQTTQCYERSRRFINSLFSKGCDLSYSCLAGAVCKPFQQWFRGPDGANLPRLGSTPSGFLALLDPATMQPNFYSTRQTCAPTKSKADHSRRIPLEEVTGPEIDPGRLQRGMAQLTGHHDLIDAVFQRFTGQSSPKAMSAERSLQADRPSGFLDDLADSVSEDAPTRRPAVQARLEERAVRFPAKSQPAIDSADRAGKGVLAIWHCQIPSLSLFVLLLPVDPYQDAALDELDILQSQPGERRATKRTGEPEEQKGAVSRGDGRGVADGGHHGSQVHHPDSSLLIGPLCQYAACSREQAAQLLAARVLESRDQMASADGGGVLFEGRDFAAAAQHVAHVKLNCVSTRGKRASIGGRAPGPEDPQVPVIGNDGQWGEAGGFESASFGFGQGHIQLPEFGGRMSRGRHGLQGIGGRDGKCFWRCALVRDYATVSNPTERPRLGRGRSPPIDPVLLGLISYREYPAKNERDGEAASSAEVECAGRYGLSPFCHKPPPFSDAQPYFFVDLACFCTQGRRFVMAPKPKQKSRREPARFCARVQAPDGKIQKHHAQNGWNVWVWNVRTGETLFGIARAQMVQKAGAQ